MVPFAALTTVVAFASPAAAAGSQTTVQASPSSATMGQSVQLTATVTCVNDPRLGPGVTFFDGDVILTTRDVGADGVVSYTTSFDSPGTHTITAAYNGNGLENCAASNGMTTVEVSEGPTPPTPPNGSCLLLCTGLINFTTVNVHKEVNVNNKVNVKKGKW